MTDASAGHPAVCRDPAKRQMSPTRPASLLKMLDPHTARVRRDVLYWYADRRRDFPWRGLTDPYSVLVSEVMLQQTQASRVAERFPRFMSR
ncbi:MAG TPA: hypothetical protein VMM85_01735, partial [Methylomirabilota bacterium]|nr:hypothetical protein [Methylomirabilota bacterium]